MALSKALGRAGRIRILLTTVLAIAAVSLFLAPTGAFPSTGSHSLASLSTGVALTTPGSAPVEKTTGAIHSVTTAQSLGRLSGLALHVKSPANRAQHSSPDGQATTFPGERVTSIAHASGGTGVLGPARQVDMGPLLGHAPAPTEGTPPRQTTFIAGWNGINYTQSQCGCWPPDASLAVGTTAIGEVTNGQFYWYAADSAVLGNVSADVFWGAGTDFIITPYLIYDNFSSRWITTAVDETANTWMVAVSQTSDPMGDWWEYVGIGVPVDEVAAFPTVGVSEFMVGVALTDYNTSSEASQSNVWVLNFTEMQSGEPTSYVYYNSETGYDLYPDFDATQGLTESADQYFALIEPSDLYVLWNVTDAPPGTTTLGAEGITLTGVDAAPLDADQYGTADTIFGGYAQWIDQSYAQNGLITSIWDASDGTEDTVRVDQGWEWNDTLWQDAEFYLSGVDLLYPSMAIDSRGDITISTTFSDADYYPGLFVFGQVTGEPYTIANGYGVSVFGDTYTADYEYGDYATGAIVPDSSHAALVGEYISTAPTWSTWIFFGETDPISVGVTSTPAAATDVGVATTFNATASGGEGAYSYNWTSLPTGCTNSEAAGVACTPSTAGAYTASVNASDAWPQNASGSMAFTVNADPTLGAITASRPGADVGQTVTFTSAAPVGGTPGFTYSWAGLPAGCGSPTTTSVICTFTATATLSLVVTATDSVGKAAPSPTFTYTVSPALSVGTPTASPASLNTGASTTLAVTATGGSGSDTYAWAGLPTGCTSSNAASISCTPSATGTFTVTVTVTDSNGASATSAGVKVTVTTPSSTSGLFGLAGSTGYLLIGVIVVVLVVLVLALLLRRKKPSPAPAAWQSGAPAGAAGGPPPGAGGYPPPPPGAQ